MGWDVNEDGKFEIAPEDKTFTDGYLNGAHILSPEPK